MSRVGVAGNRNTARKQLRIAIVPLIGRTSHHVTYLHNKPWLQFRVLHKSHATPILS